MNFQKNVNQNFFKQFIFLGACTNKIESLWHSFKQKFKEMHGCTRSMIHSYIDEYVWSYNNSCTTDRKIAYDLILKEMANYYNPGTE